MKSKKNLKKFMVLLLTFTMILPSNLQMVFAKQQNKNLIKLQAKTVTLDKRSKKEVKVIASSNCKIKKVEIIKNSNKKVATAKISKSKIYLTGNKKGKATVTIRVKYIYKKKTKTEKLQLQVNVKEKNKTESTIKLSTGKLTLNEKETKQVKITTSSKQYKIKSVTAKNNNKKIASIKISKSKLDITGLKEGNMVANIVIKYEYKKKTKTKELKLQIKVTKKAQKITIHTVSFESNGGSPIAVVKIANGEILKKPITDPQKEGYTFDGWYVDKNLNTIYNFSQKVYKDMTLYAKWKKEPKIYTRSEWIKILIDSLDTDVEDIKDSDNATYEYADIADDVNANEIQTAYSLGIIPDEREDIEQDVEFFEPNTILTREYMAYTISKALDFQNIDKLEDFQDVDTTKYPQEISNILRAEIMKLNDSNEFKPLNNASEDDVENAKKVINDYITSDKIKEKEHDNSKINQDVKDYRTFKDYKANKKDGKYHLNLEKDLPDSSELKGGEVVILGANADNDRLPLRVVKKIDKYTYECEEADISDVFSSIDIATSGKANYDKAEVTDGVKINKIESSKLKRATIGGDYKPSDASREIELDKQITDDLKLSGKITFSIPDVTAVLNANITRKKGLDVKKFKVSLTSDIDMEGKAYLEKSSSHSIYDEQFDIIKIYQDALKDEDEKGTEIDLATIPVETPTGLGLKIKISAEISMNGEVSVFANISTTLGYEYKNNNWRKINDKSRKLGIREISGKGHIYVNLGVDATYCQVLDLIGVSFHIGPEFNIGLTPHLSSNESLVCGNAIIAPGINVEIDEDTIMGKWWNSNFAEKFPLSYTVCSIENKKTPKLILHMENFHLVKKCTYGAGSIEGSIIYAKNNGPVKDADIRIYYEGKDKKEILYKNVFSDRFGHYNIDKVPAGKYNVKINVSGHKQTIFKDIEIKKNETYKMETVKVGERVKIIKTNLIALGENNSAAIREDGSLWMWGDNRNNKISDETTEKEILQPRKIMDNVKTVSLGSVNSAAIKKDGTLWLWGTTILDEILNLSKSESFKPHKIMDNVKSVSLGGSTGAAIKNDGTLWMWGSNVYGQLGDGTQLECRTPKKIMDNVKSVSVGTNYTAAIKEDGTLWMWGDNSNGKIGDASVARYLTPKKIMDNVKMVSLNGTNHSAVVKEDGTLWTWGWNGYGQLGDGTTDEIHEPKKIMEGVKTVSLGGTNSAAIKEDGSLWMWGSNSYYKQLKTDQLYSCTTPQKIAEHIKDVKLSANHVAYINDKGVLWCMGRNLEGQLGDGTKVDSDSPKEIKLGN